MMYCKFCGILAGEIECQTIYEDEYVVAFLDRSPVNPGHILVVPREHILSVWHLEPGAYARLFKVVKQMANAIQSAFNPNRVGTLVAGFDIDHAHVHVIPMKCRDDVATKRVHSNEWAQPTPAELAATARAIQGKLRNVTG